MSHIDKNRAHWNRQSAEYQRLHAEQLASAEPVWGVWSIPERELGVLGEVDGLDVLELGCGGAQWSIFLAQRGARVTGMDFSSEQLAWARRLVAAAGADVRLQLGNAEQLGFLDDSFDLVFCDHGATSFADPERVVPGVARVLRPGGRFVFNIATPWVDVCWDTPKDRVGRRLAEPYFGSGRYEDDSSVSFCLPYGDWIRLFRRCGLVVEDLVELQAPAAASTSYDFVPADWARHWPAENIWVVRKS
jgi:SAM-dependent methyltransferase